MKNSGVFFFFLLFNLQAKEPKAVIKVDTINATFQPEKIGHPNGLQITYLRDYSTRNIFVYHDNGKVLQHKCTSYASLSLVLFNVTQSSLHAGGDHS